MFVRDGFEEDVCFPTIWTSLNWHCSLFFRVQQGTWWHQLWSAILLTFSTLDPLLFAFFSWRFSREVPKLVICFTVTEVSMPVYCSGMLIWYVTFTSCHRWICMLSQKLGRTTNSSQLNCMMCSELWSTQEQLQMDQKQTETRPANRLKSAGITW